MAAAHFPEDQSPHVALALVRYWSWDLLVIFIGAVAAGGFFLLKQSGIPSFEKLWIGLREAFDKNAYIIFCWVFVFVLLADAFPMRNRLAALEFQLFRYDSIGLDAAEETGYDEEWRTAARLEHGL